MDKRICPKCLNEFKRGHFASPGELLIYEWDGEDTFLVALCPECQGKVRKFIMEEF